MVKTICARVIMIQCEAAVPDKEKNNEDSSFEKRREEDEAYFNYIYDNLECRE